MFNKMIGACVALAMMGMAASAHAATMIGMSIDGSLVFTDFPGIGNCFDPANFNTCSNNTPPFVPSSPIQPSAVVTEADTSFPEFLFDDKGFLIVRVDVDATTIAISVENTDGTPTLAPFGWDIHLTEFDLPIESVIAITDLALFPGLTATIDPDVMGIVFNYPGRGSATEDAALAAYDANGGFSATYQVVVTPLPAALPLYGTGLGLMGLFGWWRRRRAAVGGFHQAK